MYFLALCTKRAKHHTPQQWALLVPRTRDLMPLPTRGSHAPQSNGWFQGLAEWAQEESLNILLCSKLSAQTTIGGMCKDIEDSLKKLQLASMGQFQHQNN